MFNSFSKYFSMTGWRLGWVLVPAPLQRAVDVLTGNFSICPPVLSQHAECDGHVERYAGNRRVLLDELPGLEIDRLAPADGAFYVYADISHLTDDSMSWARRFLADTGVAVTPEVDFDTAEGGQYVRLSFAGSETELREG